MNTSTTPRTDEEMWTTDYHDGFCNVVNAEFAQQLEMELTEKTNEVTRLRQALELIACPERPDGTYNRDRRACELLAKEALKSKIK